MQGRSACFATKCLQSTATVGDIPGTSAGHSMHLDQTGRHATARVHPHAMLSQAHLGGQHDGVGPGQGRLALLPPRIDGGLGLHSIARRAPLGKQASCQCCLVDLLGCPCPRFPSPSPHMAGRPHCCSAALVAAPPHLLQLLHKGLEVAVLGPVQLLAAGHTCMSSQQSSGPALRPGTSTAQSLE